MNLNFFKAMETSASALTAERLRMDVISGNIANVNTTRTADGGPYRRRTVSQVERTESFQDALDRIAGRTVSPAGSGAEIASVQEDQTPFKLRYDPGHPDADANGMVRLPNVDLLQEITDMMVSSRVYEANVTAFNVSKSLALKSLEIGR